MTMVAVCAERQRAAHWDDWWFGVSSRWCACGVELHVWQNHTQCALCALRVAVA